MTVVSNALDYHVPAGTTGSGRRCGCPRPVGHPRYELVTDTAWPPEEEILTLPTYGMLSEDGLSELRELKNQPHD